MTRSAAEAIAPHLDGAVAVHVGGACWQVHFRRNDGSIAVLDSNYLVEYRDQAAHDDGIESNVIVFRFAD